MDDHILAVYYLCADLLAVLRHRNAPQCRLTDAKMTTCTLVTAWFFGGNDVLIRAFLREQGPDTAW
jgi:hypothetical protein